MTYQRPRSPKDELDGIIYFPRLCDKVRLHAAGRLHPEYQGNLGSGMDGWTCEFLGIAYNEIKARIISGLDDRSCLAWVREKGPERSPLEFKWWTSYLRNRGFRDELSEKLAQRKAESGFQNQDGILTFMDYIDADDLRIETLCS